MPITYLNLLNDARGLEADSPIPLIEATTATSGNALKGIQAVNQAVQWVLESSSDYDFYNPVENLTATSGNGVLTAPVGGWDPQLITKLVLVEAGENYSEILPRSKTEAKELEFINTNQGRPMYYYIDEGVVNLVPVPDAAYTVQAFYNYEMLRITASNISSNIIFPTSFQRALVLATHAWLRKTKGDPEWRQLLDMDAKEALNKAIIKNKFNLKVKGRRKFRVRSRDRNW